MSDERLIISADIGGTNSRFALVNEDYEIVRSVSRRTILYKKDEFVASIITAIKDLGGNFENIIGLSLGIPGPIKDGGYVVDLPNIHIQDIPLGDILRHEFGLPVFIRNDAEMPALPKLRSAAAKVIAASFLSPSQPALAELLSPIKISMRRLLKSATLLTPIKEKRNFMSISPAEPVSLIWRGCMILK
jgi:hypothetical protein